MPLHFHFDGAVRDPHRIRRYTLGRRGLEDLAVLDIEGAVGAFLALAIVGRSSQDPQTVRAAYLALTLAALLTGIVQSLGLQILFEKSRVRASVPTRQHPDRV